MLPPAFFGINPAYRLGETLQLEVERLRDDPTRAFKVVEHVDVRVEEMDEDGIRLRWRPRWSEVLHGPDGPPVTLEPELLEELATLEFDIALDADGQLIGISNEFGVLDALERFNAALGSARLAHLLTPRLLFFKLRRPIDLYFGVSGKTFPVAEPQHAAVRLPDPFGGGSYPADISFVAEPAGADVLVHIRQVSPAAPVLEALAHASGVTLPEGYEQAELVDHSEYTVDAETGQTRSVRFTRSVGQAGVRQFDFLEIRRLG